MSCVVKSQSRGPESPLQGRCRGKEGKRLLLGSFKVFILLGLFLLTGCGTTKTAPIPRDYHLHDAITKVDPRILADGDVGWMRVDENTQRKVYFNDRLTIEVVKTTKPELKKDIKTGYSYHDRIAYIVEGSAIVRVARDTRQIFRGGVFIVPSNVPFDVVPASENTIILYAYTPTREDLRPVAVPPLVFNENEIRSFVYKWFGLLDERASAASLSVLLSPFGLRMELSDKTVITSPEEFERWYGKWIVPFTTVVHKVEDLTVSLDSGKGQYRVRSVFSRECLMKDGKVRQARYESAWVLEDAPNLATARVTSYREQELKK